MLMTGVATLGNYIRNPEYFDTNVDGTKKTDGEIIMDSWQRWGGLGPLDYSKRYAESEEAGAGPIAAGFKMVGGPLPQDIIDGMIYRKNLYELAGTNLPFYSAYDLIFGEGTKKELRSKLRQIGKEPKEEKLTLVSQYSKGGLVYNVPNVKNEPDEMQSRVTGVPFNSTAEFVQDVEDRALKGQMSRLTASRGGKFINWVGNQLGIDDKTQRQHELEAALLLNEQIDKGLISENQRVVLDETGKYIEKSTPAFNELNHRLFGAKFGTNRRMKTLIQGKEFIQALKKPIDSKTDFFNNKLGFDALKQTGDYEEAKRLLVEKTIEDYANEYRTMQTGN